MADTLVKTPNPLPTKVTMANASLIFMYSQSRGPVSFLLLILEVFILEAKQPEQKL